MIHARRKDRMHKVIVDTLQDVGAVVKELYQYPTCLDVLVAFRSQLYWAEIKNDARTAERDLTDAERELIDAFGRVGVKIHIWCTPEQALRDIGAIS